MFPTIDLAGSAFERGRPRRAGARTHRALDRDLRAPVRLLRHRLAGRAAARRGYRDVIGDLDPALLAEIEGIAAGAGRHANEILALNARTEILPPSYPGEPHPDWQGIAAANARPACPTGANAPRSRCSRREHDRRDAPGAELGLARRAARARSCCCACASPAAHPASR